jgi:YD repeat-containing protein
VQYQYDARGNLTQISDGSAVTQHTWDAADRLTSTLLPTGAPISYTYDADGRRVQQNAAGQITNYLWDESAMYADIVREYDASGATIASYVFAHTDPISTQRGSARSCTGARCCAPLRRPGQRAGYEHRQRHAERPVQLHRLR